MNWGRDRHPRLSVPYRQTPWTGVTFKTESFQTTIASGACQKTGATALRPGGRQQNSLTDKTTMLHLERLPKPHKYSDRFDFIEANRYCSKSKKKTRSTLPNQTVALLANKKNSFLEDQVCIAQTTTRTDSVPKNILNSRTCNIRDTGVCCHQRQQLEN